MALETDDMSEFQFPEICRSSCAFAERWLRSTRTKVEELLSSSGENEALRNYVREQWLPKLDGAKAALGEAKGVISRRPTCITVGKRQSGKSTLIRSWLQPIHNLALPTAQSGDTTGCLTRLTVVQASGAPLVVHLYSPSDFQEEQVLQDLPSSPITIHSGDAGALRVCRHPTDDDRQYSLKTDGTGYRVVNQEVAGVALSQIQLAAREVVVPISLEDNSSEIANLLRGMDLVDAPGADPEEGEERLGRWRFQKNAKVFADSIRTVDLVVLVLANSSQGLLVGDQLKKQIWSPWLERCNRKLRGRLLVVLTHGRVAFEEVTQGEPTRFAERFKGLMQSLPSIDERQPGKWPPFVVVDEFPPDSVLSPSEAQDCLKDISTLELDSPAPASWPEPAIQAFAIASGFENLGTLESVPEKARKALRDSVFQAHVAFATEEDYGHGSLTRKLKGYVDFGPLRAHHTRQSSNATINLLHRVRECSGWLVPKDSEALPPVVVRRVAERLRGFRKDSPLGWRVEFGEEARALYSQVSRTGGKGDWDKIETAVLTDLVRQIGLEEEEAEGARLVMSKALEEDVRLKEFRSGSEFRLHGGTVTKDQELLRNIRYLQQRLASVLAWLSASGSSCKIAGRIALAESPDEPEVLAQDWAKHNLSSVDMGELSKFIHEIRHAESKVLDSVEGDLA